jgi:hypothetical protein
MDPLDAATRSASAVSSIASHFMLSPSTYQRGGELGFEGVSFYMGGRGGALGEVHGDVVAASFAFFATAHVVAGWDQAASVMTRREAAEAFIGCGHDWARSRWAEVDDELLEAVAEPAGQIVRDADLASAPLFAAWRNMAEPDDLAGVVLSRMNCLRELRMAHHVGALLAAGITPCEAIWTTNAGMAPLFGWAEPPELDRDDVLARLDEVEMATNRAAARSLSVLDATDRERFVAAASELAGLSVG